MSCKEKCSEKEKHKKNKHGDKYHEFIFATLIEDPLE